MNFHIVSVHHLSTFHSFEVAMCLPAVDNEGDVVFSTLIVKLFPVPKYILTVVEVPFIN